MKRMSTRAAIYYAVQHLTAAVKTSGAVSFANELIGWGFGEDGPKVQHLVVYSYSTPIGGVFITADGRPMLTWQTGDKFSVTTSKHQSWLAGALFAECVQRGIPNINVDVAQGDSVASVETRVKVKYDVQVSEGQSHDA